MDTTEIRWLLEKPGRNRYALMSDIRDRATTENIVEALRRSQKPHTRLLLCTILSERTEAGFTDLSLALPALMEVLQDRHYPEVQIQAAEALGRIGDSAAGGALLRQYHREQDHPEIQGAIAFALGILHFLPALPALVQALSSPDELVRIGASGGLRNFPSQETQQALQQAQATMTDPRTIALITSLLEKWEEPVSSQEEIKQRLLEQLKSIRLEERRTAGEKLAAILDVGVLDALLALLQNERSEVRESAAFALAWMTEGRANTRFVEAQRDRVQEPLIQALPDPDSKVRAAVAQALGEWGSEQAVEPLLKLIQDPDSDVRQQVVDALHYFPDERAVEPLLQRFVRDENQRVRSYAAQSLHFFPDDRAVKMLIGELQDKQVLQRRHAAEMLCWLGDERAIDALLRAVQDKDKEVRQWSVEAIWETCVKNGDALSLETIHKVQQGMVQVFQDKEREVRGSAQKILEWLHED